VGTLGKAFGVNGGYVTSNQAVITYLRETAPMYIYSNPISPAEASAALKSLEILPHRLLSPTVMSAEVGQAAVLVIQMLIRNFVMSQTKTFIFRKHRIWPRIHTIMVTQLALMNQDVQSLNAMTLIPMVSVTK